MSLFLDAALKWQELLNTAYIIEIGRKGKSKTLRIVFRDLDFDHLSGIHYATDIDFKLNRNQYRGTKLLQAVCNGMIDPCLIEKSAQWSKISDRLYGICNLQAFLNSEFQIYKFSPDRLPFFSKMCAAYLLYDHYSKKGFFLFLDSDNGCYYCKSIFSDVEHDYTANQTNWVVLKKERTCGNQTDILYVNPSYKIH